MSLTKDEISDLVSLHQRVVQSTVDVRNAELAKKDADYKLFCWLESHTEKSQPK